MSISCKAIATDADILASLPAILRQTTITAQMIRVALLEALRIVEIAKTPSGAAFAVRERFGL